MSKSGKRDNSRKYYSVSYFDWRYAWGGHWLKQEDKAATNRKFRKISKARIYEGLAEYDAECDEPIDDELDRLSWEDFDFDD